MERKLSMFVCSFERATFTYSEIVLVGLVIFVERQGHRNKLERATTTHMERIYVRSDDIVDDDVLEVISYVLTCIFRCWSGNDVS